MNHWLPAASVVSSAPVGATFSRSQSRARARQKAQLRLLKTESDEFAASVTLLRESGRIFLEGAPSSAPPGDVGRAIVEHDGVVEAHDLHVWTVTSGFPALSAHVLVEPGADCHRIRLELETMLAERFGLEHTTLQVEHVGTASGLEIRRTRA